MLNDPGGYPMKRKKLSLSRSTITILAGFDLRRAVGGTEDGSVGCPGDGAGKVSQCIDGSNGWDNCGGQTYQGGCISIGCTVPGDDAK
jgi:hypothetical protein